MRSPTPKHTSTFVKGEFERKHPIIINEISSEIREVMYRLRKKRSDDVMDVRDIQGMSHMKKGNRTDIFFRNMAKEYSSSNITFGQMVTELDNRLSSYLDDSYTGKTEVLTRLSNGKISCWNRTTSYPLETQQLKVRITNTNDVTILIDAHDIAICNSMSDLHFVTADDRDIKSHESIITSTLSINSVMSLSTFI